MEQTHDRNTQPGSDAVSDVWGEWMLSDVYHRVYHRVYLRLYLLLRRPPPPLLWSPSLSDSHKLLPQHIIHPQSLWLYFQKGWLNLNMNDHAEIDREKSWTTSSSQTLYVNSNVWRSWESAACCSVWGVQEYAGVRGGGIRLPRYPGVSLSSKSTIKQVLVLERKLEPELGGENRGLIFLDIHFPLGWWPDWRLPASQVWRDPGTDTRAICHINYQTKNMRPTSHNHYKAIRDPIWGAGLGIMFL